MVAFQSLTYSIFYLELELKKINSEHLTKELITPGHKSISKLKTSKYIRFLDYWNNVGTK